MVKTLRPVHMKYGKGGTGTRGRSKGIWRFPSTSNKGTYETIIWADQTVTCNCPGWIYWRHCRHVDTIMSEYGEVAENFLTPVKIK